MTKPRKTVPKSLRPVDLRRCQAEKPIEYSFMTLGGQPGKLARCTNKPTVIATETKPGPDGRIGSMSLCTSCLKVFEKQMPPDFADIIDTKDYGASTAAKLRRQRQ